MVTELLLLVVRLRRIKKPATVFAVLQLLMMAGDLVKQSAARGQSVKLTGLGGTSGAANGSLSHNSPDCGNSGGQVVGYVHRTGPGNESSAAGIIINGWFNSPSHYQVLTWPTLNRIGLAFYQQNFPDGSWTIWGVGNLCP